MSQPIKNMHNFSCLGDRGISALRGQRSMRVPKVWMGELTEYRDKAVLLPGASSGIGNDAARAFAEHGAIVRRSSAEKVICGASSKKFGGNPPIRSTWLVIWANNLSLRK